MQTKKTLMQKIKNPQIDETKDSIQMKKNAYRRKKTSAEKKNIYHKKTRKRAYENKCMNMEKKRICKREQNTHTCSRTKKTTGIQKKKTNLQTNKKNNM